MKKKMEYNLYIPILQQPSLQFSVHLNYLRQFQKAFARWSLFLAFVGQTSEDSKTHKGFDTHRMVPNSSIPIPQTITYSILSDFEATFTARHPPSLPSFLTTRRRGGSQSKKTCYQCVVLVNRTSYQLVVLQYYCLLLVLQTTSKW